MSLPSNQNQKACYCLTEHKLWITKTLILNSGYANQTFNAAISFRGTAGKNTKPKEQERTGYANERWQTSCVHPLGEIMLPLSSFV